MKNIEKIDLGSVQVHKKVFAEIIASALEGVDGVRLIDKSFGNRFVEMFGQRDFPGIEIKADEQHDVYLELKIFVQYGLNIPDAARQVQETVKKAVNKTLDISLKEIHVNVQGIERGEK